VLPAVQCIVITAVCLFVAGWVGSWLGVCVCVCVGGSVITITRYNFFHTHCEIFWKFYIKRQFSRHFSASTSTTYTT